MVIIPFLSSFLYMAGGQYNKWYRWLMGLPIAIITIIFTHNYMALLCIATYWIATSAFPYGEHSWLNFLGEYGKFAVCGFMFGLASVPAIWTLGLAQAIIGAIAFCVIKYLDDKGIIHNPYVELLRGFCGTALFFVA